MSHVAVETDWNADNPANKRKLKEINNPLDGSDEKYGGNDIINIVKLLAGGHQDFKIPIAAVLELQAAIDSKEPNLDVGTTNKTVLFWDTATSTWSRPKQIVFDDIALMPTPPTDQASDDFVLQAQWNSATRTLEYQFKAFTVGNQILSVLPLPLNNTKLENIETQSQIWTLHVGTNAPGTSGNTQSSLPQHCWYYCTNDAELYRRDTADNTLARSYGWVRKTKRLTASRAMITDAAGKAGVSPVTSAELAFLDGVTSAIQTQLNGKEPLGARLRIDRLEINSTTGDVLGTGSSNRKRFFRFFRDANPVNYLRAKATAAGSALELSAEGTDTNISINVKPKGTGYLIGSTETMMFPLSDEENEFDAGTKYTVRLPHTIKVLAPYACLTVAPGTGKTVAFDVADDGVSIFTTRPSITGTGTYSTGTLDATKASIAANSKIEFKVHSITSDSAARGAKVGFRTLVQ